MTEKRSTRTHTTRILIALSRIYEDPKASIPEILQAAKLAAEVIERRPKPKRKTDKDKILIAALGGKKKAPPKQGQTEQ